LSSHNPFWFASEELLTDLLRAEIHTITELFERHPDLHEFFDLPEATVPQRAACFVLLAHRELMGEIYETFAGRYEQSPSLGEEEKDVLRRTQNLFDSDAPAWVLEVNEVAEHLPSRICDALPEPLHRGGFIDSKSAEAEAIRAAASELSSVQQIQALSGKVLDQQLQRLEGRWAAARPVANPSREIIVQGPGPSRRKGRRKRDEQRMSRDKLIAEIADISPTPFEFLKLMDERKVKPQPTWIWPGSWLQAYKDPHLRKLIQQDKSRALARVQRKRQG
jgi:AcrR family transcriptional regulator